jgi:hypothetical protein
MHKKDKHPSPDSPPFLEKNEPDVTLELLLEEDLNRKLGQSARHKEVPLEKIILKILTKRFK